MPTLLQFGAGLLTFVVLDGLWLGVVMTDFYVSRLLPIARVTDGQFTPLWPAAALVYVLLAAGIALFAVPRAETLLQAAGFGFVFGLIVYGVYDLTNYSTLERWTATLMLTDMAWGSFACAVAGAFVWWTGSR